MQSEFPRGIEVITGTIIRNRTGKILLVTSPKWEGKWVIAGGHVEPGETILDAALREAKEELGMDLKPIIVLSFKELIASKDFHRKAHFISFLTVLEAEDETVTLDTREISDYRWVTPKEALTLPLGGELITSIKDYLDFIKKESLL